MSRVCQNTESHTRIVLQNVFIKFAKYYLKIKKIEKLSKIMLMLIKSFSKHLGKLKNLQYNFKILYKF